MVAWFVLTSFHTHEQRGLGHFLWERRNNARGEKKKKKLSIKWFQEKIINSQLPCRHMSVRRKSALPGGFAGTARPAAPQPDAGGNGDRGRPLARPRSQHLPCARSKPRTTYFLTSLCLGSNDLISLLGARGQPAQGECEPGLFGHLRAQSLHPAALGLMLLPPKPIKNPLRSIGGNRVRAGALHQV